MLDLNYKIVEIDTQVNNILAKGGMEALLLNLADLMPTVKMIMDNYKGSQFDAICLKYKGFYQLMKLLEDLAYGIQNGDIKVP